MRTLLRIGVVLLGVAPIVGFSIATSGAADEKTSTDKASTDKASTDKASTDKASTDKASTDKASTDKASTPEPTATKPAADNSAAAQPSSPPTGSNRPGQSDQRTRGSFGLGARTGDAGPGTTPGGGASMTPRTSGFGFGGRSFSMPNRGDRSGPAAGPSTRTSSSTSPATPPIVKTASGNLQFNFRAAQWRDVLEWFAKQADFSLSDDVGGPAGTFNYTDSREYTPTEAIDVLNSILTTKGYVLLRRYRMLILVKLDDPIPDSMPLQVNPESLGKLGEYELVRTLFDLDKFKPEEAEAEAKKLLGPQGTVVALPKTRQLQVTDMAGRLRAVQRMINRIDNKEGYGTGNIRQIELHYVKVDDVMHVLRPLLDIPDGDMAAKDGSIRIADDGRTGRVLFLTGKEPEKVAKAADIIERLDVKPIGPQIWTSTSPMSPESAQEAVEKIKSMWVYPNRLHVLPSAPARTVRPAEPASDDMPQPSDRAVPEKPAGASPAHPLPSASRSTGIDPRSRSVTKSSVARASEPVASGMRANPAMHLASRRGTRTHFVAQQRAKETNLSAGEPLSSPGDPPARLRRRLPSLLRRQTMGARRHP